MSSVLIIDNYDSFTYNLVQRLGELNAELDLRVFRNDQVTVEEIEATFAQPDLTTAEGLRDRAMLEVFYATAIRRLELAQLDLADVDPRHATLLIRAGKGQQDRFVPG